MSIEREEIEAEFRDGILLETITRWTLTGEKTTFVEDCIDYTTPAVSTSWN